MLTLNGVSAEEIDVDSSVVTESPISAELDNSLSSYEASDNELSSCENYEISDSCESYESFEPTGSSDSVSQEYYYSSGYYESYDYYGYEQSYISCGEINTVNYDLYESLDTVNCPYSFEYECGDVNDVDITSTSDVVDSEVILNNYDIGILSEIRLNENNELLGHVESNFNLENEIDGVGEAFECNIFGIDVTTQVDDLLGFENDCYVLDNDLQSIQEIYENSEPVFGGILVDSGYISSAEVYYGTILEKDLKKLLEYVGSDDMILFASLSEELDSDVMFSIIGNITLNGQIGEINLDGYKISKALLKYYPSNNEIDILIGEDNGGDEHSHLINDTNSHGLDYAYIKHVNVINKDMPNLIVLTSSKDDSQKQSVGGCWDGLNDVLGARISTETLLPDHKAIWTPLLLLLQQDLQKSIVNSHADDNNKNKKINDTDKNDTDENSTDNKTNSSKKGHKYHYCPRGHYYPRYWHYDRVYAGYSQVSAGVTATSLNNNTHDNLTDDDNKTSNVTAGGSKSKYTQTPNLKGKGGEPTYTLIYAIFGIVILCLLFNSSYMKRND